MEDLFNIEAEISVSERSDSEHETTEKKEEMRTSTLRSAMKNKKPPAETTREEQAAASGVEDQRPDEPLNLDSLYITPDEDAKQNIEALNKRGLTPGDHGYILQPKNVKPKAVIFTIKTTDTIAALPDGLFTVDIIEAIVKATAGKVRCQARTILKLSPVHVLVATPRGGSLISFCDEFMSGGTWVGVKVKMTALIVSQEDSLNIIEAFEAREADKIRHIGDPRDQSFLKDRKEGESPRKFLTEKEEEKRKLLQERLKTIWETKKFMRKPKQVIQASLMEDTTPNHVECSMCGGLGHNQMKCPTRRLFVAASRHGRDVLTTDAEDEDSDFDVKSTSSRGSRRRTPVPKAPSKKSSNTSTSSQNFGGKPPKLPKFSGDSSRDTVSYAQWQFEVQTHSINYTESKMKEAIVVALTGTAADIIRMMGREVSVEDILRKLSSIYGTVGTMETMLEEFYQLEQESGEDVAKYASRVETMAGTILEHFPTAPVVLRDRFFKGLRERIQNRLRHRFDDPKVGYMELLEKARKAEKEITQKSKDQRKDKTSAPAKKGGILPLIKTNQAKLSIPDEPEEEVEVMEVDEEPLPGEDPVDRLGQLEKEIVELRRAAFGTASANGPARPSSSNLKPTAPAFKPRTTTGGTTSTTKPAQGTNQSSGAHSQNIKPFYSKEQKPVSQQEINQMLHVTCYNCRGIGHMQNQCPTPFVVRLNGQQGATIGGSAPETTSQQTS